MRLSALFEEFSQYLKVERGASHRSIDTYRRYFAYFINFTKEQVRGPLLIADFTPELCRSYQYFMASKELQPGSIRVRLAVLGSFGKWAVKHSRLEKSPMDICRQRRAGCRPCQSGKPWRSSSRDALTFAIRPSSR